MAVAITRCAGTQNLWEFWYAIDEDVLQVGQFFEWYWLGGGFDGMGCGGGGILAMVESFFFTIYDGRSMDIFGNGGISKKHN
jgi:hypothetical protein